MLKGIPSIISPELLKTLAEMGHGDEIVIGDANFPAEALNNRVIRADGHGGRQLVEAILSLVPLDSYADFNFILMNTVEGDGQPPIWKDYGEIGSHDENFRLGFEERFAFYERAKRAYAVVASGEREIYANVIIKKGVIA